MIAQIISAAITIPFMYFASYKPTQQMFVKKPKIDRALFINVLWVIVITLFISFALNNIITMSPLIGLVFRGIVFGNMRKIMNVPQAVFLSALLFGLIHFNIVQFVYAFLLGLVLAAFMYKSGHVYAAMIGHITANAFAVIRTETGILKWTVDGSVMAWVVSVMCLGVGAVIFYYYAKHTEGTV